MPQMMPINWMMSFMFFLLAYMMFNMLNYYIFEKKNQKKNNLMSLKLKNLNWKW
uniref:ATP synthase F0 subunit 8 n=1 Tax=Blenina donans TaxID=944167 RepID=UPI0021CCF7B9|nr:ATP synthase F0 subunit 8 [Blenina donans]UWM92671.1 ATP synthase F0 subunit 8 [Blenina donans]